MARFTASIAAAFMLGGLVHWLAPARVEFPLVLWRPHPVSVARSEAQFELPAAREGRQYLVVVSNLSRNTASYMLDMAAERVDRVEQLPLAHVERQTWIDTASAAEALPVSRSRPAEALPRRSFWLHVGGGSVDNPATHRRFSARLAGAGDLVRVYVDEEDRVPESTVRAIVARFESAIVPSVAGRLGMPGDVDGDGVFTIVLTSWLSRLDGGQLALGGLVRAHDFCTPATSPFANEADVLFLNAGLRPGAHLETLLAHEFAHAITCSRRQAPWPFVSSPTHEAAWLSEAIAHVAENLHSDNYSNLDYRVAGFLSAPQSAPLVVDDYQQAGLYRDPLVRGSAYLFLRWCVDEYGLELLPRLVDSSRASVENLEAATSESFDELYRRYSVDLFTDSLWPPANDSDANRTTVLPSKIDTASPLAGWGLAGPRTHLWNLNDPTTAPRQIALAGTSSAYLRVVADEQTARRITIRAAVGCELQVTITRLPDDLPCPQIEIVPSTAGRWRVVATPLAGTQPWRLSHLSWQACEPGGKRRERPAHGVLSGDQLASAFDELTLASDGEHVGRPLTFAGAPRGPLLVSLAGVDATGRRVAAWAEVDLRDIPRQLASRR